MFAGRFALSQSNLEKALALYDPISHHTLVQNIGFHPHIQSHGYLGKHRKKRDWVLAAS